MTEQTEREYYERIGKIIGTLSPRAKVWGELLSLHLLDYPFQEAYDTGVDRLLNNGVHDGQETLEVAYATLSQEYPNLVHSLMESSIIVAGKIGAVALEKLVQCPILVIRESAQNVLKKYNAGEYNGKKSLVLTGSDKEVKEKLDRLIKERTKSWRD